MTVSQVSDSGEIPSSAVMMLHPVRALQLLVLLLLLHMSSSAVHNNGTEARRLHLDPEEKPADEDLNQARTGGRWRSDAAENGAYN